MPAPTLSVVLPNYNHGHYLAEAILGIATQSRPPDEFLILDDGSTDNSLEIIQPFLGRFPFLRLVRHEQNRGIVASVERLVSEARGDYLFAAAADDVRLPGFFARAMELAERFPAAGLVFGMVRMIDPDDRDLGLGEASRWHEPLYADPPRFLQEFLRVERPSQGVGSGTIFRRAALLEAGVYRPELGSWSDTFAFRAVGLKDGVCYLPQEVVHIRVLSGSYSQQTNADPRRTLDLIARGEYMMKSARFRDRFPADYVREWRQAYRWQVIRDYFLGPEVPDRPRPSFLLRNLRRLPRVPRTLSLFFYRGDLSCYREREVSP